jgi:hypothetical protein
MIQRTATGLVVLLAMFLALPGISHAQDDPTTEMAASVAAAHHAPQAAAPELTEKQISQAEGRGAKLAGSLQIEDAEKSKRVEAIMVDHYRRMEAWHVANDPALAVHWQAWNDARDPNKGNGKDEAQARLRMGGIDAIHLTFKPQHYRFLDQLAAELTPEQIERVKDQMTSSPGMLRTYNAYLAMIPEFTDEQKQWIFGQMQLAREEAMDTTTGREATNLFKKYKVLVEAYIDDQGYDYRARYKAWASGGK